MILEKLDTYIYNYKNLIDDPYKLIEDIESTNLYCDETTNISQWSQWTASNDFDLIYGENKNGTFSVKKMLDHNDFNIFKISSTINYIIQFAIKNYCYNQKIKEPWLPDFFQIKKYFTGVDMGPHTDSSDPTDINHPIISGVLYLNDDYEGGEISFPNQNILIKPTAGSLLIFPSAEPYLHHPKKIINGNKYMIPLFWFKESIS